MLLDWEHRGNKKWPLLYQTYPCFSLLVWKNLIELCLLLQEPLQWGAQNTPLQVFHGAAVGVRFSLDLCVRTLQGAQLFSSLMLERALSWGKHNYLQVTCYRCYICQVPAGACKCPSVLRRMCKWMRPGCIMHLGSLVNSMKIHKDLNK